MVVPVFAAFAPLDFFFSKAARNAALVGSVSLSGVAMPQFNHLLSATLSKRLKFELNSHIAKRTQQFY